MESGGAILRWNVPNWITVLLMVAIGYAIIGLGAQALRRAFPSQ